MVVVQVMFDRWESEKSEISRGMLCKVVSSCMQQPSKIMHIGTNPLHLGAAMGPWAQKPHDPGEISGFSCEPFKCRDLLQTKHILSHHIGIPYLTY